MISKSILEGHIHRYDHDEKKKLNCAHIFDHLLDGANINQWSLDLNKMVVVEHLSHGPIAPADCNGAQKFQSLSYSAISLQSDDDNGGVTGLSQLSSPGNDDGISSSQMALPANQMAANSQNFGERAVSHHGYFQSQSLHDESPKSDEDVFSPVHPIATSSAARMDLIPGNDRTQTRHHQVKRIEQTMEKLEAQLDEVESSYGSMVPSCDDLTWAQSVSKRLKLHAKPDLADTPIFNFHLYAHSLASH
jgi:hypothetical protein